MKKQNTSNIDLEIAERVLKTKQILRQSYSKPIPENPFQDNEQEYQPYIVKQHKPEEQNSSNSYLFGDDNEAIVHQYKPKVKAVEIESLHQKSEQQCVQKQQNDVFLPLRRRQSKALSEINEPSQSQPKKKTKYKKQSNMGNIFYEEKHIDNIFKHLCEPDGKITVNSLGHALQKYKINFEVRDVVEMIELYYQANNIEVEKRSANQDEVIQDQMGELNLSVRLNEAQFKELYKFARKKK